MRGAAVTCLLLLAPALAGCGRDVLPAAKAERLLARVREAHEAKDYGAVVSRAKPLIKAHPRTQGSEEAAFLAAYAEEERGRPTAAFRLYETLLKEHPASSRVREISRREFAMAAARHARGKRRLKGHFMNLGMPLTDVLSASARHDPYGEHAAYALLIAATIRYDDEEFEEARTLLGRMLEDHPRSPWVPQGEFLRAMASFRLHRGPTHDVDALRTAEAQFRGYLERHPEGADAESVRRMLVVIADRWAEHQVRAARLYEKLGKPDAAGIYYRSARDAYPDSPWAEEARHALAP